MQYREFRNKLKDFSIFSLADIRKFWPDFYGARLTEWQGKGYIRKLRRGHYMFADIALDEEALYMLANRLYAPSYVSFESALTVYGLIPEGVYAVTSATSKKTARFATPAAEFSYRTMKPSPMFGYDVREGAYGRYKIAEREKTVLDYLYHHPWMAQEDDFSAWRFNSAEFLAHADERKFRMYARAFRNKAFMMRVERLLALMRGIVAEPKI